MNTANSHDWYPPECCAEIHCHVVDKVHEMTGGTDVMVGTDKIWVPNSQPRRSSPDGKYHICYSKTYDGIHFYCFFVPGDA